MDSSWLEAEPCLSICRRIKLSLSNATSIQEKKDENNSALGCGSILYNGEHWLVRHQTYENDFSATTNSLADSSASLSTSKKFEKTGMDSLATAIKSPARRDRSPGLVLSTFNVVAAIGSGQSAPPLELAQFILRAFELASMLKFASKIQDGPIQSFARADQNIDLEPIIDLVWKNYLPKKSRKKAIRGLLSRAMKMAYSIAQQAVDELDRKQLKSKPKTKAYPDLASQAINSFVWYCLDDESTFLENTITPGRRSLRKCIEATFFPRESKKPVTPVKTISRNLEETETTNRESSGQENRAETLQYVDSRQNSDSNICTSVWGETGTNLDVLANSDSCRDEMQSGSQAIKSKKVKNNSKSPVNGDAVGRSGSSEKRRSRKMRARHSESNVDARNESQSMHEKRQDHHLAKNPQDSAVEQQRTSPYSIQTERSFDAQTSESILKEDEDPGTTICEGLKHSTGRTFSDYSTGHRRPNLPFSETRSIARDLETPVGCRVLDLEHAEMSFPSVNVSSNIADERVAIRTETQSIDSAKSEEPSKPTSASDTSVRLDGRKRRGRSESVGSHKNRSCQKKKKGTFETPPLSIESRTPNPPYDTGSAPKPNEYFNVESNEKPSIDADKPFQPSILQEAECSDSENSPRHSIIHSSMESPIDQARSSKHHGNPTDYGGKDVDVGKSCSVVQSSAASRAVDGSHRTQRSHTNDPSREIFSRNLTGNNTPAIRRSKRKRATNSIGGSPETPPLSIESRTPYSSYDTGSAPKPNESFNVESNEKPIIDADKPFQPSILQEAESSDSENSPRHSIIHSSMKSPIDQARSSKYHEIPTDSGEKDVDVGKSHSVVQSFAASRVVDGSHRTQQRQTSDPSREIFSRNLTGNNTSAIRRSKRVRTRRRFSREGSTSSGDNEKAKANAVEVNHEQVIRELSDDEDNDETGWVRLSHIGHISDYHGYQRKHDSFIPLKYHKTVSEAWESVQQTLDELKSEYDGESDEEIAVEKKEYDKTLKVCTKLQRREKQKRRLKKKAQASIESTSNQDEFNEVIACQPIRFVGKPFGRQSKFAAMKGDILSIKETSPLIPCPQFKFVGAELYDMLLDSSDDGRRRRSRTAELTAQKKKSILMLREICNTLKFIEEYNEGPPNNSKGGVDLAGVDLSEAEPADEEPEIRTSTPPPDARRSHKTEKFKSAAPPQNDSSLAGDKDDDAKTKKSKGFTPMKVDHYALVEEYKEFFKKSHPHFPHDCSIERLKAFIKKILDKDMEETEIDDEVRQEEKAFLRIIRGYKGKADQERLEKTQHEEERGLLLREYEYVNRTRRASPEDIELDRLESQVFQFSCPATSNEPTETPCFLGPDCSLCSAAARADRISIRINGRNKAASPILYPRFRRIDLEDVDNTEKGEDSGESRFSRKAEVGADKKALFQRLQEMYHTLQFIECYNKGMIKQQRGNRY